MGFSARWGTVGLSRADDRLRDLTGEHKNFMKMPPGGGLQRNGQ
jgi:hypothetical protein